MDWMCEYYEKMGSMLLTFDIELREGCDLNWEFEVGVFVLLGNKPLAEMQGHDMITRVMHREFPLQPIDLDAAWHFPMSVAGIIFKLMDNYSESTAYLMNTEKDQTQKLQKLFDPAGDLVCQTSIVLVLASCELSICFKKTKVANTRTSLQLLLVLFCVLHAWIT